MPRTTLGDIAEIVYGPRYVLINPQADVTYSIVNGMYCINTPNNQTTLAADYSSVTINGKVFSLTKDECVVVPPDKTIYEDLDVMTLIKEELTAMTKDGYVGFVILSYPTLLEKARV